MDNQNASRDMENQNTGRVMDNQNMNRLMDTQHTSRVLDSASSLTLGFVRVSCSSRFRKMRVRRAGPAKQSTPGAVTAKQSTPGAVPVEQSTSGAVPVKQSTCEAVPLKKSTSEAVPLKKSTSGVVIAKQSTPGAVPVEQSTSGAVPVEQSTCEAVPLKKSTSGAVIAKQSSSAALTAKPSTSGVVTAKQLIYGAVTAKQSSPGAVPVEQSSLGAVSIKQSISGTVTAKQSTHGTVPVKQSTSGCCSMVQNSVCGSGSTTRNSASESRPTQHRETSVDASKKEMSAPESVLNKESKDHKTSGRKAVRTKPRSNSIVTGNKKTKRVTDSQNTNGVEANQNTNTVAANQNTNTVAANQNTNTVAANQNTNIVAANKNANIIAANQNTSKVAANQNMNIVAANQNKSKVAANQNTSKVAANQNTSKVTANQNIKRVALNPASSRHDGYRLSCSYRFRHLTVRKGMEKKQPATGTGTITNRSVSRSSSKEQKATTGSGTTIVPGGESVTHGSVGSPITENIPPTRKSVADCCSTVPKMFTESGEMVHKSVAVCDSQFASCSAQTTTVGNVFETQKSILESGSLSQRKRDEQDSLGLQPVPESSNSTCETEFEEISTTQKTFFAKRRSAWKDVTGSGSASRKSSLSSSGKSHGTGSHREETTTPSGNRLKEQSRLDPCLSTEKHNIPPDRICCSEDSHKIQAERHSCSEDSHKIQAERHCCSEDSNSLPTYRFCCFEDCQHFPQDIPCYIEHSYNIQPDRLCCSEDSHKIPPDPPVNTHPSSLANLTTRAKLDSQLKQAAKRQRAHRVKFFRNGDRFYQGLRVPVSTERFRTFDSLLTVLNGSSLCDFKYLPHGVKFIFSLDGGRLVEKVGDFQDGHSYVCSSLSHFRPLDYTRNKDYSWNAHTSASLTRQLFPKKVRVPCQWSRATRGLDHSQLTGPLEHTSSSTACQDLSKSTHRIDHTSSNTQFLSKSTHRIDHTSSNTQFLSKSTHQIDHTSSNTQFPDRDKPHNQLDHASSCDQCSDPGKLTNWVDHTPCCTQCSDSGKATYQRGQTPSNVPSSDHGKPTNRLDQTPSNAQCSDVVKVYSQIDHKPSNAPGPDHVKPTNRLDQVLSNTPCPDQGKPTRRHHLTKTGSPSSADPYQDSGSTGPHNTSDTHVICTPVSSGLHNTSDTHVICTPVSSGQHNAADHHVICTPVPSRLQNSADHQLFCTLCTSQDRPTGVPDLTSYFGISSPAYTRRTHHINQNQPSSCSSIQISHSRGSDITSSILQCPVSATSTIELHSTSPLNYPSRCLGRCNLSHLHAHGQENVGKLEVDSIVSCVGLDQALNKHLSGALCTAHSDSFTGVDLISSGSLEPDSKETMWDLHRYLSNCHCPVDLESTGESDHMASRHCPIYVEPTGESDHTASSHCPVCVEPTGESDHIASSQCPVCVKPIGESDQIASSHCLNQCRTTFGQEQKKNVDGMNVFERMAEHGGFIPRLVFLVRFGRKPRRVFRLLLNRKSAQSLEQVMTDITQLVVFDLGRVRKVYTLTGRQVTSLVDFFQEDTVFLVCGQDKPQRDDFRLDEREAVQTRLLRLSYHRRDDQNKEPCLSNHRQDQKNKEPCLSNHRQDQKNKEPCLSNHRQDQKNKEPCLSNSRQDQKNKEPCMSNHRQDQKNKEPCLSNQRQDQKGSNPCLSNHRQEYQKKKPRLSNERQGQRNKELCLSNQIQDQLDNELCLSNQRKEQKDTKPCLSNKGQYQEDNTSCPFNHRHNKQSKKPRLSNQRQNQQNKEPRRSNQIQDHQDRKPGLSNHRHDYNSKNPRLSSYTHEPQDKGPPLSNQRQDQQDKNPCLSNHRQDQQNKKPGLSNHRQDQRDKRELLSRNELNIPDIDVLLPAESSTTAQVSTPDTAPSDQGSPEHSQGSSPDEIRTNESSLATSNLLRETQSDLIESVVPEHTLALPKDFKNKYEAGALIGSGQFSAVFECRHRKTCKVYGLKIVDKQMCIGKEDVVENEVVILRCVKHPNIIRLLEDFSNPAHKYYIMELVEGDLLLNITTSGIRKDEYDVSRMLHDLASALRYLHSLHIVHRDVQPGNIVIRHSLQGSTTLKLGDFGLATEVRGPLYAVCGNPAYVAPEVIAETGYGVKVDIWSAGVIVYSLLCGFLPFLSPKDDQKELLQLILNGRHDYPRPYWDNVTPTAKCLVSGMLEANPVKRMSACQLLEHKWVSSGGCSCPDTEKKTRVRGLYTHCRRHSDHASDNRAGIKIISATALDKACMFFKPGTFSQSGCLEQVG